LRISSGSSRRADTSSAPGTIHTRYPVGIANDGDGAGDSTGLIGADVACALIVPSNHSNKLIDI
jgi:hypothetical protein